MWCRPPNVTELYGVVALAMDMGTLPPTHGGRAARSQVLADSHVELQRQRLRRKAGVIGASLVMKLTMHGELAGHGSFGTAEKRFDREFLGVDVQLLLERKWEAQSFARWIGDPACHNVAGRHQLDSCGN